jgi:PAS domain S-box-containing protein
MPELIGQPVEVLVPQRFAALHAEQRAAFGAARHTRPMGAGPDLTARHKDGRELPVEISLSPVSLDGWSLVVAAIRDISARRQAEAVLRRQAALLDLAPSAIIVRDLDGVISYWNDAAERLYGWRSGEAVGQVIQALLRTHYAGSLAAQRAALVSAGVWEGELLHRRRDGSELVVASRQAVQRDEQGCPEAVLEINTDITERKQVEQDLFESQERFRLLVDRVQDYAIFRLTPDGHVATWNVGAERLKGYRADEILGRHFSCFYTDADVQAGKPERLLRTAEAEGRVEDEGWRVRKDGSRFWADVVITALRDEAGKLRGFAKIARDMTERRRAEEQLRRTAAELARSNADLEQFAYVASHDLQEPLRMVASYTQLLARRYAGRLDADADEFIGYAVGGAKRMQRLIDDLLTYARVGSAPYVPVPTDTGALVDQVVADLRLTLDEEGAVISRGPLPIVPGDPRQLGEVFQNLIGNALKYRGPEPPRVELTAERQGAEWLFSVRDNGIGIDPAQADRIFLIFQRLHAQADYEGTGLGLAICKRVIERHGGRIWVESRPGAGATFRFTLPAAAAAD